MTHTPNTFNSRALVRQPLPRHSSADVRGPHGQRWTRYGYATYELLPPSYRQRLADRATRQAWAELHGVAIELWESWRIGDDGGEGWAG